MDDPLRLAIPSGQLVTAVDGAVFVGVLVAEALPLPGVCPLVVALTSVALHAGLDLPTAALFVRGVRDRYLAVVDDMDPSAVDEAHISAVVGDAVVDGLAAVLPPGSDQDAILAGAFPRYRLILDIFLDGGSSPPL